MGGIIFGAMGGFGDALQSVGKSAQDQQNSLELMQARGDIDFSNQSRLAQLQSSLEQQKQIAIMNAKNDIENAPAQRFADAASEHDDDTVPVTAAPVTQLSGADPNSQYKDSSGAPTTGLLGDMQSMKQQYSAMLDRLNTAQPGTLLNTDGKPMNADAIATAKQNLQGILAQIDRQQGSDQAAADKAVEGQERPATEDEKVQATLDELKRSDPQAYLYGKQLLPEKYMKVGKDDTIIDPKTGKTIFQNRTGMDEKMLQMQNALDRKDRDAEYREKIANIQAAAKIEVAAGKSGNVAQLVHYGLVSYDKEISEKLAEVKILSGQLPTLKTSEQAKVNGQIESLKNDMANLGQQKRAFAKQYGFDFTGAGSGQSSPSAYIDSVPSQTLYDAAPAKGLPPGAVREGFQNNKPAYRLPNGQIVVTR